jgi:hypothetical protein
MPETPPPEEGASLFDAILYLVIGSVLTYFFFEPISTTVASFVRSLLPSGW